MPRPAAGVEHPAAQADCPSLTPPGDYLQDLFHNNTMRQLCCAGMKIASVQQYMIQNVPAEHQDTDNDLLSWCLDALHSAPRCPVAVQQHGDISYATGP
eukprot:11818122-Karenia_brevis.AAC.1